MLKLLAVFLSALLLPAAGLAQAAGQTGPHATLPNGCIVGLPCAFGIPLPPPPNQSMFAVDGDGCLIGSPCPWRGSNETAGTKTTIDSRSGNVYRTTRHQDGTTDSVDFNPRTGSMWDSHTDALTNSQYGHDKSGRLWTAPLTVPRFETDARGFIPTDPLLIPPTIVFEPSEHDLWLKDWWKTGGKMSGTAARDDNAVSGSSSVADDANAVQQAQDDYERRQRDHAITAVLSQMHPGALANAARTAARDRCLSITDTNQRTMCIENADRK